MKKNRQKIGNAIISSIFMLFFAFLALNPSVAGANELDMRQIVETSRVNLTVENASLKTVLYEIKEQSHINFIYKNSDIENAANITLKLKNVTVSAALTKTLEGTGLSYVINNNNISIVKAEDVIPVQLISEQAPIEIKGKVLDEDLKPIVGATIIATTGEGTITDGDGAYVLTVGAATTVEVSYMGYVTQIIPVTQSNSNLVIKMVKDEQAVEDVVVVGYGNVQKVRDVVGSISTLGTEDIESAPPGQSVQALLQGRAAGVNVQIQSASPTSPISVIIRGRSSLTGDNQPLWVIDGVPQYNASTDGDVSNVLYNLNLDDIESINILKDASSTAIYGSRGANGVVVVTTKRGVVSQNPVIEFSTTWGISVQDFNNYEYMNTEEYMTFTRAAMLNEFMQTGSMDYFTRQYLDEAAFLALNTSEFNESMIKDLDGAYYPGNDTDWVDMVTQNPWTKTYNLSLRGGAENLLYVGSLGYTSKDGIIKTSSSDSYTGRVRVDSRIRNNISLSFDVTGGTRTASDKDELMGIVKKVRPDLPAYNEDGTIYTEDYYTENPLTTMNNTDQSTGENFQGTVELKWNIKPYLVLSTAGSVNYSNSENLDFESSDSYYNTTGATRSWSRYKSNTKQWTNTLMYYKRIGDHDIQASLTAEAETYDQNYYYMYAYGFPDNEVLIDFGSATNYSSMNENSYGSSMLSQIFRVQYKFADKYLFTGTVRNDGSSKFGVNSRWGLFPSAGAGWSFTEEEFVKNANIENILSYGKLRASYGVTGSQNLSYYDWATLVGSNQYNESAGIYPSNIGNPDLEWEETTMLDLALELEFWESRVRAVLGYYNKRGDNLMYSQTLPTSSGFSSMTSNMASTKAYGYEFSIDVDVLKKKNSLLTFGVNGSNNTSKVLKFNDATDSFVSTYTIYEVGKEIGSWYGYETYNRLIATDEEMTALQSRTETGALQNYRIITESSGDIYYVDQNGDGVINSDDLTIIGTSVPDLFGGMNLSYYNSNPKFKFSVVAQFTYQLGGERFWYMAASDVDYTGNYNQSNKIAGLSASLDSNSTYSSTTLPNATPYGLGDNGVTSLYVGSTYTSVISDYWLYDASYLRLSSLSVRYSLPKTLFANTVLDEIEFSFNASNLFTLTTYPGWDVSGNFSNSSGLTSNMSVDYSYYPQAKTFSFGVKFVFK